MTDRPSARTAQQRYKVALPYPRNQYIPPLRVAHAMSPGMQAALWQLALVPALRHSSAADTAAISPVWETCGLIMACLHTGRLAGAAGGAAAARLCSPSTAGLPSTQAVQQALLSSVLPERPGA